MFRLLYPFLFVSFAFFISACANKNISKTKAYQADDADHLSERSFSDFQLEALANTTTILFVPEHWRLSLDSIQLSLDAIWNFTPIKAVPIAQKSDYLEGNYSYLKFHSSHPNPKRKDLKLRVKKKLEKRKLPPSKEFKIKAAGDIVPSVYLSLSAPIEIRNKKNKLLQDELHYARKELHLSSAGQRVALALQEPELIQKELYQEPLLLNGDLGFIKVFLLDLTDQITNNKRRNHEKSIAESSLKNLENNTLYLPKYALRRYDVLAGDLFKYAPDSSLFLQYPFEYSVLSKKELSSLLEADIEVYFLDVVLTELGKYLNVYSSHQGLLYRDFKKGGKELNQQDLRKLIKKLPAQRKPMNKEKES